MLANDDCLFQVNPLGVKQAQSADVQNRIILEVDIIHDG
jgi:hypothetical protein